MSRQESLTQAQEQIEPHLVLQQTLGLTEDIARDLTTVVVGCPEPGVNAAQTSLGEFMTTAHGAEKMSQVLRQTQEALELGANPEKALRFGLGAMAVTQDENGRLARVSRDTEAEKKN